MPEKSLDTCRDDITQLHEYVKQNYNYEMTVMRPPKGEFSEQTLAVTQELGYKSMLWSFAYKDWDANNQGDPTASLNKLNERLHPGAIYLLHAVSATNADILGDFIDHAQSEGYKFVLPEC
jgi:peptidoglycan-N-acetylmuramic acid deacetylase